MLTLSFGGQKSSVDISCGTLISNSSCCERLVRKVRGIGQKSIELQERLMARLSFKPIRHKTRGQHNTSMKEKERQRAREDKQRGHSQSKYRPHSVWLLLFWCLLQNMINQPKKKNPTTLLALAVLTMPFLYFLLFPLTYQNMLLCGLTTLNFPWLGMSV